MKKSYFRYLLAITLFAACVKKQTEPLPVQNSSTPVQPLFINQKDTIRPLPYFPVFPNSYWKYINQKGDTVVKKTSDNYQRDIITIVQNSVTTFDTSYVPFYNGIGVWGSKMHTGPLEYFSVKIPHLVTVVNDSMEIGNQWLFYYYTSTKEGGIKKVLSKDTTVNVLGITYQPVIVIGEYVNDSWGNSRHYYSRYYAKGIGLIQEIQYLATWPGPPPQTTLRLVSYKIGNP